MVTFLVRPGRKSFLRVDPSARKIFGTIKVCRTPMYFSILGCWQLSDKISENNPPLTNPGENFSLCPSGILIHDGNHDLLCFQPLELDSKESKTATSHGRILVSLMIHNL